VADIPAGAQRSGDGQWWWDGSQWQPVTSQAPGNSTDAQSAQGTTTGPASSEHVGQLSADGQWQWDGAQWQPAQAAPGSAAETQGGPRVTVGMPTTEERPTDHGPTEFIVHYRITNSGTTPIAANALLMGFFVAAVDDSAESAANLVADVAVALAVGEVHHGSGTLQVDPGTRLVWINVTDNATGEVLATSEATVLDVAGHHLMSGQAFDDTQTYTLTHSITSVEHVSSGLYRVHYDIQSDRDVPVGLKVSGRIECSEATSSEIYELPTAIEAGRSHAHYLTMGGTAPSHSTAFIELDPGGPSQRSDAVVVDIAEDGTPTMSR
jgi:hypothetical protein